MKTKLLKKLTCNVKIETKKTDGITRYQVSVKNCRGKWDTFPSSSKLKIALRQRRFAVYHQLHCLGKSRLLKERREKRTKQRKQL